MDLSWQLYKILSWRAVAFKRCHAHYDSNFNGEFFIWFD